MHHLHSVDGMRPRSGRLFPKTLQNNNDKVDDQMCVSNITKNTENPYPSYHDTVLRVSQKLTTIPGNH